MCEGLYITAHDLREIQLHLTLVVFHSSIVLLHSSFFLPLSVPGRVAALTHVFFSVSGARILCLLLSPLPAADRKVAATLCDVMRFASLVPES